jgi:hypothetical protein
MTVLRVNSGTTSKVRQLADGLPVGPIGRMKQLRKCQTHLAPGDRL